MASEAQTPEPGEPLAVPDVPRPLREPPHRGRVLVVSPHPDDETVGLGGMIALHARLGDPVCALFVTTGVNGDLARRYDPDEYIAIRRSEAEAAARVLGISETEFWEYPDSCVVTPTDMAHVCDRLADAIARWAPDVVYAPHVGETHSDHHIVGRAVSETRARTGGSWRLMGYEVWTPLRPHYAVDISPVYETKREAMACYPSQLAQMDLRGAIEGLNRYRAILLEPGAGGLRWAEVLQEVA